MLATLVVGGLAAAVFPSSVGGQLRAAATAIEAGVLMRLVGLMVALLAAGVLALELRRQGRAVALAGEAGAMLATSTIVDRLREDIEGVEQVTRVRPTVIGRRGAVDVILAVSTDPHVEVPTKAAEIREVAAGTIERLGLKLGRLTVELSQGGDQPIARLPSSPP